MLRQVVLDTGPLFSALICNYSFRNIEYGRLPSATAALEAPLLERSSQKQFLELLSSIDEKLTTSHVIAELQGLERARLRLYGNEHLNFWRESLDLLLQWNIDEKLIRLLDMAANQDFRDLIPELGLVDTGLIELAREHGCPLITQDERTLFPRALALGVDCRLVKQLVLPAF